MHRATSATKFLLVLWFWLVAFLWRAGGSEGFVVKWVRHSSLHMISDFTTLHNHIEPHRITSHDLATNHRTQLHCITTTTFRPIPSHRSLPQIWWCDHKTACQLISHCITWCDRTPNRIASSNYITSHHTFFLARSCCGASWSLAKRPWVSKADVKSSWKAMPWKNMETKLRTKRIHRDETDGWMKGCEGDGWICRVSVKVMMYVPLIRHGRTWWGRKK